MINTGSIYLIVKDFEKSVEFYKLLLEKDVLGQNMNRFAIFGIDKSRLCIMNGYFDKENPDKVVTKGKYYINARTPYYYFSLKDPDNNTIEITGSYKE